MNDYWLKHLSSFSIVSFEELSWYETSTKVIPEYIFKTNNGVVSHNQKLFFNVGFTIVLHSFEDEKTSLQLIDN